MPSSPLSDLECARHPYSAFSFSNLVLFMIAVAVVVRSHLKPRRIVFPRSAFLFETMFLSFPITPRPSGVWTVFFMVLSRFPILLELNMIRMKQRFRATPASTALTAVPLLSAKVAEVSPSRGRLRRRAQGAAKFPASHHDD